MSNPRTLFLGALLLVGLVTLGAVAGPQLLTRQREPAVAGSPSLQPGNPAPDPSSSPPPAPDSDTATASPGSAEETSPVNRERRPGDIAQDRAAPGAPAPSGGPTAPSGGQIEDQDINRLLTQDLEGQPRPPDDIAERASRTASTWLEADLIAAGRWTDPRVRAVQVVLDERAGARGQLRAVAIWSGTTPSAEGEELHRTEVAVDPSGGTVTGLADS